MGRKAALISGALVAAAATLYIANYVTDSAFYYRTMAFICNTINSRCTVEIPVSITLRSTQGLSLAERQVFVQALGDPGYSQPCEVLLPSIHQALLGVGAFLANRREDSDKIFTIYCDGPGRPTTTVRGLGPTRSYVLIAISRRGVPEAEYYAEFEGFGSHGELRNIASFAVNWVLQNLAASSGHRTVTRVVVEMDRLLQARELTAARGER
jgi:hypothetical protein